MWAYGCTLYEIATGYPPNAGMEPGRRLGATLGRNAPRLDHAIFSEGLCALVAFVLEPKPADRPSMEAVLEQEYIANTEETHPTTSLAELVKTYYRWERSGGHRHSLFFAGGAPAAEFPETLDNEGSWNFSLTENFEQHIVDSENLTETSSLTPAVNAEQAADSSFESYPLSPTPAVFTPATSPRVPIEMSTSSETPRVTDETSTETTEKEAYIEERVKRGEQAMQGLFDENKDSYKYEVKNDFVQQRARHPVSRLRSDLPLRHETEQSSLSHNELEVRARNLDTDSMPNIDLANVNTIKANRMHRFVRDFGGEGETNEPQYGNYGVKRETMDLGWSFPQGLLATTTTATTTGTEGSVEPTERPTVASPLPAPILVVPPVPAPTLVVPPQPRLQRANTAPVHHVGADSRQSVIDLDELYDSDALSMAPTLRAPPTAAAAAAAAADPVQQESDVETEENKSTTSTDGSLAFDYGPTHAEISEHSTTSSDNEVSSGDDYHPSPPPPLHHLVLQESSPPSAAAMREGAPAAVVEAEVTRLLEEWNASLGVLAQAFAGAGDESHVGGGEEGGEETGGEGRNGEGEE